MTPQHPEGSLGLPWDRCAVWEEELSWKNRPGQGQGERDVPELPGGEGQGPLRCALIPSLAGGAGAPGESPGKAFPVRTPEHTGIYQCSRHKNANLKG